MVDTEDVELDQDQKENPSTDFICPDTIVAVRADSRSNDIVWFVRVTETELVVSPTEDNLYIDCYGDKVPVGSVFLKGRFLERDNIHKHYTTYKLDRETIFYYTNVVFPYVEMEARKKMFVLKNEDYTDIIVHIENTGFSHL